MNVSLAPAEFCCSKTATPILKELINVQSFSADPIVLQLTCVLSLQRIVTSLSSSAAGLLVAFIMVPLAQIQNIHDVGSLSIFATAAMVAAAGIALIKLLAMPGSKLEQTSLLPPPGTGHVTFLTSLMNIIFAFGGQVNWMRYESAMKSRLEFKYAVEVGVNFMLCSHQRLYCYVPHNCYSAAAILASWPAQPLLQLLLVHKILIY